MNMRLYELLLVCLLAIIQSSGLVNGKKTFKFGLPPPPISKNVVLSKKLWFKQTLNHFDPTDSRIWKQKYYINDEHYTPGGPIFLMIGGEGPASPKWMVNGSWVDYATRFNAFMVQLEHRYYGESHPTSDLSVKNLRYLSSEQALADLAYFISKFKEERNLTESKVIAFGGSYPGSLAVWFRLKYPHIVHASVSSSAPLVAHINFKEYLDVTVSSIEAKGSQECVQEIRKATNYVYLLLKHRIGWKIIENALRLCQPLDGLKKQDISNLFENLAENFEDVVQYNEDNRGFEGVKGTNVTVTTLCDIMENKTSGSVLNRLGLITSLRLKIAKEKCFEHTYKSMIEELQKISWDNKGEPGGRQWIYQTCTEFGFYQTSDSVNQPFGRSFPLEFYIQQCEDIFGKRFSIDLLKRGVERTNIMYGGKNPKVTRVVLINGSIDQWHYLGVTKALSDDVPAIFINGTAHCANMYPASPNDPPQLKEARKQVEILISTWLNDDSTSEDIQ